MSACSVVGLLSMFGAAAPDALAQAPPPPAGAASTSTEPTGYLPEPGALTKAMAFVDSRLSKGGEPKDGFYPEFGNMITGSGWISAGPGYRHRLLNGKAVADVSGALSWNFYKMVQASFEMPHLANDRVVVGSQVIYQDMLRVNYFGLGNDSLKSNRSGFRLNGMDALVYTTVKPRPWLSLYGRFGSISHLDLSTMTGRSVDYPNTLDVFTEATAPGLTDVPALLHADTAVAFDSRNHVGHPTRGGLFRVRAEAYHDLDFGRFSFRRYDIEGSYFVPLVEDKWVLALHGWEVFSDTSGGNTVPFYLMPSLGGKNPMRGYADYRFHDRDMQAFNVESRWALFTHVDAAIFGDFGKVAPTAGGLDFKDLKKSYGAGLRVHNRSLTFVRLDMAHGSEGWRILFYMSDPFKRSTMKGTLTPVIPFVP